MDRQTGMLTLGVRGKGEHLGYLPKPKTFSYHLAPQNSGQCKEPQASWGHTAGP